MAKKEVKMDILLENTIALQKTLVDLALELKSLNKKVSALFELFESASAAFKETRTSKDVTRISPDIVNKIDTLVEQNKTLAKGLLLLEQAVRERELETHGSAAIINMSPRTTKTMGPAKPLRKRIKQMQGEEKEETAEETETSESEEYKAQPLPEFSF